MRYKNISSDARDLRSRGNTNRLNDGSQSIAHSWFAYRNPSCIPYLTVSDHSPYPYPHLHLTLDLHFTLRSALPCHALVPYPRFVHALLARCCTKVDNLTHPHSIMPNETLDQHPLSRQSHGPRVRHILAPEESMPSISALRLGSCTKFTSGLRFGYRERDPIYHHPVVVAVRDTRARACPSHYAVLLRSR